VRSRDRFQHVDRNTVLQLGPRHKTPCTDELLVMLFHRTTGTIKDSALMDRADAEKLHAWLGVWLAEGWDGVRKQYTPPGRVAP
jgi:hypothetical protein